MNKLNSLQEELTQDLRVKVVEHKRRFVRLFSGRYKELLPSLIVYKNNNTSVDFLKTEVALRSGHDVVIGENSDGVIMVLGYVKNNKSSENPSDLLAQRVLVKQDIQFVIPKPKIPKQMKEISYVDNCKTGNFVVLRNKTWNFINDYDVIEHYTEELSELVLSRYSIAMQAKLQTVFVGDVGDEDINQMISAFYNGAPFAKVSTLFDKKDNILTFENSNLASSFVELKREYQNKISELNNMLGVNSLAVEKSSGVSDTEAKSNMGFTTSNANIYLLARNEPLDKLNTRYGLKLEGVYNDEVESELSGEEGEVSEET